MFDFETMFRNWFGMNETLSEVQKHRRESTTRVDREIKSQRDKRRGIVSEVTKLQKDIAKVDVVIAELLTEKSYLTKD